jgi:O-antigen/teichoic acid export membrane protein
MSRFSTLRARLRQRLATGHPGVSRGATNIFWNLLATLANQGSTFITTIVLARLLNATDFGIYVVVLSTAQIATLIAGAGMGYTATKYLAEFSVADPARASRIFGFCLASSAAAALLLGGLITLGGPFMAEQFFAAAALSEPMRYAGGICLFMTVNAIITGALAGLGQFRQLGYTGLASGLAYVGLTTSFTQWMGVHGTVIGLMASGAVQTVLLTSVVLRAWRCTGVRPDVPNAMAERAVLIRFALPAAIAGLSTAGSLWLGQLVLTRGAGLVETGLYSVAANLLTLTMLAPSVANTVGMSMLNKARGAGDTAQFDRLFKANLGTTLALVVLGAGTIALFGRWILAGFGPAFAAALPALLALLTAALPEAMGLAYYQILQSRERMWQAMRLVILPRDLALPLVAIALVPRFGALGLAMAFLVSRSIYFFTTYHVSRRVLD